MSQEPPFADGLIAVRSLTADDYAAIRRLQEVSFPGMTPWTRDEFESQIQHFPEGQIGVTCDGELIATASSLIIEFDEYGDEHTWEEISSDGRITNHDPDGDTLYGIEVLVAPEFRGMKIGRRLYDARRQLAQSLNLKRVVVGGRVPGFEKAADGMDIYDYVDRVRTKELYDPVLTFQLANGFQPRRIVTGYLDEDTESRGHAIVLEWVNLHYAPTPHRKTRRTYPVRICTVQYRLRAIADFDEFSSQCEYFVDVASGYKSDFVVFPEIFTLQLLSFIPEQRPGLAVRALAEFTDRYLELFRHLAIKYDVNIVGGSHYTEEDGRIYNIAYLFHRSGQIDKQYKLHITPNEREWWGVQPGQRLDVFETDRGRVCIQICYDVEFPELGRLATERGAQIIFVPFCTDNRQGYLRVRHCAQARAIENQVYVVTSGGVGNLPFVANLDVNYAQSGIFTPSDFPFARDGVAGECQANIETAVIADVDLEVLRRARLDGTVRNWHDRRHDLYSVVSREQ